MDETWRPTASPAALELRARVLRTIREFFHARHVLEVETPILSAHGNTDVHIENLRAEFDGPRHAGARTRWLRTSPEYPLKRMLAAGIGDCYELGRVFRNGEAGRRHNPEFTMLEWYRVGWDHRRLMDEVAELLQQLLALVGRRVAVRQVTYAEWFAETLGIDPHRADEATLRAPLTDFMISPEGLTRDDWLDLLITHGIEPTMRDDELLLVHDYPASQAALARVREGDPPVAERFEAFLGRVELANGYHELGDAREQRQRFERDLARRRDRGAIEPPIDEPLLAALDHGLPDCAGVALGVDRVMMCLLDTREIADVMAFPFGRA